MARMNPACRTSLRIGLLLATALALPVCAPSARAVPLHQLPRVTVMLHGQRFITQVATTDATRAHGLMNRTHLAADEAMLFVFRHQAPRWFWMKDTRIPLDMLFFDARRRLVSMQLDARPCTGTPCTIYPSGKEAMYVLEVAAGSARRIGAHPGDRLVIEGSYGTVQ